jgi:ribonuclease PH
MYPPDQLRPVKIRRRYTRASAGSVLIRTGRTTVLCTASVADEVPAWRKGQGKGWITAEYNMLPGSTSPRKPRRADGRSTEIQRLIGRSLRAVADLGALGERTVTIDCDVLEADGGTRTASITAGWIALVDAIQTIHDLSGPDRFPLRDSVAAVGIAIVRGAPVLDPDYELDAAASVDMNVVMTGSGRIVEIQGSGEEATFTEKQLLAMLRLARRGVAQLTDAQRESLGKKWPFATESGTG